ncbi:uncharacterized protein LOC114942669 [Nylanderia fulva]|uniref:uncharacterized protein LOC114942669 n=1 Tax=Nylanderia fulva TaxID=613905 RepID=UPI0010FB2C72|nr:uncharacterized protein LOC114942669 [Nylanderia fulva]
MIRALQINLNHCEIAQDLLMQTARELKLDIVLISEPYKQLSSLNWITDVHEKATIWACGTTPLQGSQRKGSGFIRAKFEGIQFYSCYAPPSLTQEEFAEFLDQLVEDARMYSPVAIAGDFNAWAVDWGSKATNTRGCLLLEAMSLLDVVLLNTGDKPTFIKDEASSIVDLTFVSSTLARGSNSWGVSDIYTASDHCAIYWEVSPNKLYANRVQVPCTRANPVGWRTSTYDPGLFKIALEDRPLLGKSASEKATEITLRLTKACDATMPRRHSNKRFLPVYWWNENISELRIKCVKARRTAQRARKTPLFEQLYNQYKEARLKLNKAIKESKRNTWTMLLEEVEKDPWGRPYQIVVKQLRQEKSTPTCPILLRKIVSVLFPTQPKSSFQLGVEES